MIISKTPLRASFFGGGTDFHEYFHNSKYGYGCVVSTSIKMYIYIIVNKRFDDKIRLVYQGNEFVDSVDEIKHNIIREALKITGIEKGIEKGIAIGEEKGIVKGTAIGIEKGTAIGIEKGREETNLDHARKMKEKGYDLESIHEITGLPIEKIKEL